MNEELLLNGTHEHAVSQLTSGSGSSCAAAPGSSSPARRSSSPSLSSRSGARGTRRRAARGGAGSAGAVSGSGAGRGSLGEGCFSLGVGGVRLRLRPRLGGVEADSPPPAALGRRAGLGCADPLPVRRRFLGRPRPRLGVTSGSIASSAAGCGGASWCASLVSCSGFSPSCVRQQDAAFTHPV